MKLFLLEALGSEASTFGNSLLPQSKGNTDIWKDRRTASSRDMGCSTDMTRYYNFQLKMTDWT